MNRYFLFGYEVGSYDDYVFSSASFSTNSFLIISLSEPDKFAIDSTHFMTISVLKFVELFFF